MIILSPADVIVRLTDNGPNSPNKILRPRSVRPIRVITASVETGSSAGTTNGVVIEVDSPVVRALLHRRRSLRPNASLVAATISPANSEVIGPILATTVADAAMTAAAGTAEEDRGVS